MIFNDISSAYQQAADKRRAAPMAKYMKNHFVFLGIAAPDRRAIDRLIMQAYKNINRETLLALVEQLWQQPEREYHYAACDWLVKHKRLLLPQDFAFIEWLLTRNSWWDSVDTLAAHVVGYLAGQYPVLGASVTDGWSVHNNIWLRRTAILHQLHYKTATQEERLFDYCLKNASDKDFFIKKAIGWALRQYARSNQEAVYAFVAAHQDRLSALSYKEALKHLSLKS